MNYQLFHAINAAAGRWEPADQVMRFAAVNLVFVVFAVAAVLVGRALRQRRIRAVVCLGVALAIAFILAQLLAHTSGERRPFQDHPVHQLIPHAPGVSLPSDHATAAFAIAFGVFAFLHRRIGLALTAAAVLIGFARIWVGVHYPGDIVAAAVIAALSVFAVYVSDRGAPVRPES